MKKAFLLCAGLGTRLRPLTQKVPKCLLPINGKPLLEIWLDLLQQNGVDQVLINMHWLPDQVVDFAKAYQKKNDNAGNTENPNIYLYYEPKLLGSAGTLWSNQDWIDPGESFFILYGDNLTCVDLSRLHAFHLGHDHPFTLGVFHASRPERCGIAEVDEDWNVIGFMEKPEKPVSDLAAAGVYVADKTVFDVYQDDWSGLLPFDLGYHIIPKLTGKMKAYVINEFLMDIGTPEDYAEACAEWNRIGGIP